MALKERLDIQDSCLCQAKGSDLILKFKSSLQRILGRTVMRSDLFFKVSVLSAVWETG